MWKWIIGRPTAIGQWLKAVYNLRQLVAIISAVTGHVRQIQACPECGMLFHSTESSGVVTVTMPDGKQITLCKWDAQKQPYASWIKEAKKRAG